MKNYINTLLLILITICMLKMAFFDDLFLSYPDEELSQNSKFINEKPKRNAQHVIVWNGYNYANDKIPLSVYCVNCR